MQLRAFWRTFNLSNERRFKIGRVLLTGATGFLGAFLLREILLQTKVYLDVTIVKNIRLLPLLKISDCHHC